MPLLLILYIVDILPGVWLSSSTDDRVYVNDSVITWNKVYFNQSQSLKCVTEKQLCCSGPNPNGEWYYPNRTRVPNIEAGYDFYTERRDDGTVHLYIRNTSMPFKNTMQFCCELPNTHDLTQKLCVHLGESINLTAFNYCSLTFCAILFLAPVINEVTTTTISTYIDISFIQFRLFGIGNCYEWVVSIAKVCYIQLLLHAGHAITCRRLRSKLKFDWSVSSSIVPLFYAPMPKSSSRSLVRAVDLKSKYPGSNPS